MFQHSLQSSWLRRPRWSSPFLRLEKSRMGRAAVDREPPSPARIETVRYIPQAALATGVLQWGSPCTGEPAVLARSTSANGPEPVGGCACKRFWTDQKSSLATGNQQ